MKIQTAAIYVLNYNGEQLLPECLPSLCSAVKHAKYKTALRVIDNASTDKSVEIMRTQFPEVQVIQSENNYFSSFNRAIETRDDDVVILLNNDVKVDINFVDPLVNAFELHEDAFMASPHCMDFNNDKYEGGCSLIVQKFGWWGTTSKEPEKGDKPIYTASMGACLAFRRDRFLQLQGYDAMYNPGILEDLDLCYRGWKRGWKGYNILQSKAFHKGQASFTQAFGVNRMRVLAARNTFLFIWKNVSDPLLLIEHFIFIGPRLIYALVTANPEFVLGWVQAIKKISIVQKKRKQALAGSLVPDSTLINVLGV
jgi:GT2 family glycosyltransferase